MICVAESWKESCHGSERSKKKREVDIRVKEALNNLNGKSCQTAILKTLNGNNLKREN